MPWFRLEFPFSMGNGKGGTFGMRYQFDVVLTAADKLTIVNDATTEYTIQGSPLFANDVTLGKARLQEYVRNAGPPPSFDPTTVEVHSTVDASVGTALGTSVAPQLALVVTLQTANPARRALGRVYTPPPPENVVDGAGNVSDAPARATWIQGIAEAVEGAVLGTDIDHIVHSVTYGDVNEITNYLGRARIDSQRRRRTRGG